MFSVTLGNASASREDLLQWQPYDRLGILVNRPFGGLGAGLLSLLARTAFYDADRTRRRRPLYPPIYIFHVGGRWGFYGELDFWPDRKEIFVANEANEILQSINQIGISHLALPERAPKATVYRYKEPEEALDRLKQCYLYSPLGTASAPDVTISTESAAVIENLQRVAMAQENLEATERTVAETPRFQTNTGLGVDMRWYASLMKQRLPDIPADDPHACAVRGRLDEALKQNRLVESLRRVTPKAALDLLG